MATYGSWLRIKGSWLLFEHPLSPSPLKGFHLFPCLPLPSGKGEKRKLQKPAAFFRF
jgi:hypothetical protein